MADTASLLDKLLDSCPFLEKIDFDPGSEPNTALSLTQELARFPRLRQVNVSSCWGLEAFRVLATKPSLHRLGIPTIIGPWNGPSEVVSVRDLRELSVGGDAPSLSCLFSLARFYALKSANIYLDSADAEMSLTVTDITGLLALFYNAVSTSGLESFEFAPWPHRYEAPFDVKPPLRELVAPILPIRSLRSFTLTSKYPVASLDDTDIEALTNAWPGLQHFSAGRGPFTSGSSVSFHALHHLHKRCKGLFELSLPRICWPTIGIDVIPTPLDNGSPTHPLQELSLPPQVVRKTDLPLPGSGAELSDEGAEAMACYLFALFPRLDLDRCKRVWDESRPREMRFGTNSATRRALGPKDLHCDDRWWRVTGHMYSLCRARDGL
ncbi:hypothetical protein GSI_11785 [Ganoderma sinense ZZ0214-1]|uniref:F-box domain-containing protein n=1 Tax=Ganoderma sinense ZZ0214-1 TaxID=1077348 RepID=A0A2G8RWY7_9APHY|nr:hypothetical protein GSI_11785 [Ganoderma sinense ZZ0214-1]